ncbi:MAG TPA: TIGR03086 family metal-binding protein [Acidimicrobiia bacterium]|jgi:uncharacterized protein (TIGR03086 family)|nr:TIGR03086 family metal-binding protein [Acidimicrobiia bacterium]
MDTTTSFTTPSPFALDIDPRPLFHAAVETATEVIGRLRPDQLDDPTPCTEYDVRDLLGHIVGVLPRIAAMGRNTDPMSAGGDVTRVADDAWLATWRAAAADAEAAWDDDAALGRTIVLPWATDTGAAALLGYVSEITVHTWDIATATGQHPQWNDEVVGRAFDLMRSWLPGENRPAIFAEVRKNMGADAASSADPFAEVVPVADDAPPIERLVAWNGRRP